ncbi:unnamed protein product [Vitrella brassicaformis CCMP3155]|uniref:Uncharacterized protein n=1 Tax=Vitrella brassicaformis (strain CCMP3155) TaxID=1169540 RepID=A0A0G4EIP7_VITBC|nr:unnamed protein product [Vitrella brassicaformis CCMP3155]|eukprot:CEL95868.1 unnamed protein product [Vitrella brassicaformis CCMP3155]
MSDLVPDDLWRRRILPSLLVHEAVCVRATCRPKAALVTAALLVERIDGSLARHSLTGLIDIDRTAPLPFTYVLRAAYVLEQGSNEWPGMRRFIRLAAIYRLTPANGLPLVLSSAIYRLFGHRLTDAGNSLALQQIDDNGRYRIAGGWPFRVVPLGELPGGHGYAEGYKRTDPVIRWPALLFPSFSTFLLERVLVRWCYGKGAGQRKVLRAVIGRDDARYGRVLLTDSITEGLGIVADFRYDGGNLNDANPIVFRSVIVSGWRPNETIAAHLWLGSGYIYLFTTEAPVADRSQPLADRFPVSVGAARRLLRPLGLESDVIDRGTVVG